MRLSRRSIVLGGLAASVSSPALASAPAVRELSFLNLHTGESLKAAYWEGGGYAPDALKAIAKVLRDHRTGEAHAIDPRLLDLLSRLAGELETSRPFQVISGYRSPATNAMLDARSSGVATRSLHMDGKAIDVRVAGVDLPRLRDAALALQLGGVGYYPKSDFVHVDVGRVRRW